MSPGKSGSLGMVCKRIARAGLCHFVETGGTARKKPVSVVVARKQAICRNGPLDMFLRIMTKARSSHRLPLCTRRTVLISSQSHHRNLVFNTLAAASLLTSEEKLSEMRTPEQQPLTFALWAVV